jgi:hypothetical protein
MDLRIDENTCEICRKHGKDEVIGSIPIEGSNISRLTLKKVQQYKKA